MNWKILTAILIIISMFCIKSEAQTTAFRQIFKKEIKNNTKDAAKKSAKTPAKSIAKSELKNASKSTVKGISAMALKSMSKEVAEIFVKGSYHEMKVTINGAKKTLLVSPKFDPYLKVSRKYTGDFDPVAYHKGNPRFVKDGCETNLGRMKRGLAPLYKNPSNNNIADHGYSAFELHHGGQKADPDYFALMAEDHKTYSSVLHPKRTGSEISRNEFSKKERTPLYMDLADNLENLM